MFTPQLLKIRKMHKNFKSTWEYKCINLKFGKYGLKALEFGRLQPCHLETIRKLVNRETKKAAKIWYRVFPNISITKKPNEVRMGKGKGAHSYWAFNITPGQMILEIDNISLTVAKEVLHKAAMKLPFQARVVLSIIE